MKHLSEQELTQAYFGDVTAEGREHIERCAVCARELQTLARTLDALKSIEPPELAPHWEQGVWRSIESRASAGLQRRSGRPWWMLAPTLAMVAVLAFAAGMWVERRSDRGRAAMAANTRERVLLIALGDHLERSQIVLAEIENAPESKTNDISAEQQLASRLVGENRLLRLTAARAGDGTSAAFLAQLERVLVEIAHAPDSVSASELDELKGSIESQGLLFKTRVIGSNAKEKGMKL
jgi:hypothetical protein